LVEFIEAQVRAAGVDPTSLMFEITETEAIANLDQATEFAGRLARLGCQFALDDFGTGFGSYLHLTHLPVDVVKIDGRFVRQLAQSPVDQAVVDTMTALSHRLNKRVVAEQVEDQRTVELLTGYGVDYAQGYFLARPAPAQDVLAAARAAT
jgi:EAL domain-containing protein (putative c-di-GMP-specific phosphodiesterase class I)